MSGSSAAFHALTGQPAARDLTGSSQVSVLGVWRIRPPVGKVVTTPVFIRTQVQCRRALG